MSKELILYPARPVKYQSFKGVKKCTIPNQSMSLKEIIRRFVKREALPTMKEGIFVEGEYDLEKLSKEDLVIQNEVLAVVKADVAKKKSDLEQQEVSRKEEARSRKAAERAQLLKELSQQDPILPKQP